MAAVQNIGGRDYHPSNIQRFLDENSQLISAIVEYQNKGKINEATRCQQLLHRNLSYLLSVAGLPNSLSGGGSEKGMNNAGSPNSMMMQGGSRSYTLPVTLAGPVGNMSAAYGYQPPPGQQQMHHSQMSYLGGSVSMPPGGGYPVGPQGMQSSPGLESPSYPSNPQVYMQNQTMTMSNGPQTNSFPGMASGKTYPPTSMNPNIPMMQSILQNYSVGGYPELSSALHPSPVSQPLGGGGFTNPSSASGGGPITDGGLDGYSF